MCTYVLMHELKGTVPRANAYLATYLAISVKHARVTIILYMHFQNHSAYT